MLIYRLVTCATVEEKIYKRQLLKGSLSATLEGSGGDSQLLPDAASGSVECQRGGGAGVVHSRRLFGRAEMKELFSLEDPSVSPTEKLLRLATAAAVAELEATEQAQAVEGPGKKPLPFEGELRAHLSSLREQGVLGFTNHTLVGKLTDDQLETTQSTLRQPNRAIELSDSNSDSDYDGELSESDNETTEAIVADTQATAIDLTCDISNQQVRELP